MFEMIRGRPPFKFRKDQTVVEKMNIILKEEPQIPENCSPEASDLLSKLLKHEPTERIGCWEGGALDVKQHPFFRGIDWEAILDQTVVPPFIPPTKGLADV